jgi:hypothetical protein
MEIYTVQQHSSERTGELCSITRDLPIVCGIHHEEAMSGYSAIATAETLPVATPIVQMVQVVAPATLDAGTCGASAMIMLT